MPLVDSSRGSVYHDNYLYEGTRLWYSLRGEERPPGTPHIRLGYCRFVQRYKANNRARLLVDTLPIVDGQAVMIFGAGYGWLAEALRDLLPASDIVATDTGSYVQTTKDSDETAEITAWVDAAGVVEPERSAWISRFVAGRRSQFTVSDEDLRNAASRNRLLGRTAKQRFDWGITEHMLEWLTDAEAVQMSERGNRICGALCHLVTPFEPRKQAASEPRGNWNWKWLDSDDSTTSELAAKDWYTTTNWSRLIPTDTFMRG